MVASNIRIFMKWFGFGALMKTYWSKRDGFFSSSYD